MLISQKPVHYWDGPKVNLDTGLKKTINWISNLE